MVDPGVSRPLWDTAALAGIGVSLRANQQTIALSVSDYVPATVSALTSLSDVLCAESYEMK